MPVWAAAVAAAAVVIKYNCMANLPLDYRFIITMSLLSWCFDFYRHFRYNALAYNSLITSHQHLKCLSLFFWCNKSLLNNLINRWKSDERKARSKLIKSVYKTKKQFLRKKRDLKTTISTAIITMINKIEFDSTSVRGCSWTLFRPHPWTSIKWTTMWHVRIYIDAIFLWLMCNQSHT